MFWRKISLAIVSKILMYMFAYFTFFLGVFYRVQKRHVRIGRNHNLRISFRIHSNPIFTVVQITKGSNQVLYFENKYQSKMLDSVQCTTSLISFFEPRNHVNKRGDALYKKFLAFFANYSKPKLDCNTLPLRGRFARLC